MHGHQTGDADGPVIENVVVGNLLPGEKPVQGEHVVPDEVGHDNDEHRCQIALKDKDDYAHCHTLTSLATARETRLTVKENNVII